jgi:hypothetical protein
VRGDAPRLARQGIGEPVPPCGVTSQLLAPAADRDSQAVLRSVRIRREAKALIGDDVADNLLGQAGVPESQQCLPVHAGGVLVIDGLVRGGGRSRSRVAEGPFTASTHHKTPVTSVAPRSANADNHQGPEWSGNRITGKNGTGPRGPVP